MMVSDKGKSGKMASGMDGQVKRCLCLCTVEKSRLKNDVIKQPY